MDNDCWYARDKDGILCSYDKKPFKLDEEWSNGFCKDWREGWREVTPDFGYDYIKWEDEFPVLNAEPVIPEPDSFSNLFKLYYLEQKGLFIATIPVYVNKNVISTLKEQLESTLGSKVVAINGEFEYIKELHNLSS